MLCVEGFVLALESKHVERGSDVLIYFHLLCLNSLNKFIQTNYYLRYTVKNVRNALATASLLDFFNKSIRFDDRTANNSP